MEIGRAFLHKLANKQTDAIPWPSERTSPESRCSCAKFQQWTGWQFHAGTYHWRLGTAPEQCWPFQSVQNNSLDHFWMSYKMLLVTSWISNPNDSSMAWINYAQNVTSSSEGSAGPAATIWWQIVKYLPLRLFPRTFSDVTQRVVYFMQSPWLPCGKLSPAQNRFTNVTEQQTKKFRKTNIDDRNRQTWNVMRSNGRWTTV